MKNVYCISTALGLIVIIMASPCFSAEPNTPTEAVDLGESLRAVAQRGDLDAIKALLAEGVDVNASNAIGVTPLHVAAGAGQTDTCELLLAGGANANVRTLNGQTPLHWAASSGQVDTAQRLVAAGADVDARDQSERTPLQIAYQNGHAGVVQLFRERKRMPDIAVMSLSAPPNPRQGDTVVIRVTVAGRGNYEEAFDVRLVDTTSGREIGVRSTRLSTRDLWEKDANVVFTGQVAPQQGFGDWLATGDVNGDRCADLLVSAGSFDSERGQVYLFCGGSNMDNRPERVFVGENVGDRLGDNGVLLADLNRDGFDDVILGARYFDHRGRVYIYWGGVDLHEAPDIIIEAEAGVRDSSFGRGLGAGDVNGDGWMDLIISAPLFENMTGRSYLYYGPIASDTLADVVFTGEAPNTVLGAVIALGDVDADGCDDLLLGSRYYPVGGSGRGDGRAWLFYGERGNSMTATCDLLFETGEKDDEFATGVDLFDIDNDGHADLIISSRRWNDSQGRVSLFWGSDRANMDNVADLYLEGDAGAHATFGGDHVVAGYLNGDEYGDIITNGFGYCRSSGHGRSYIFYGNKRTRMDSTCDETFTGEHPGNLVQNAMIGDFNGDGHGDIVVGGWGYPNNTRQGKVWLFYGEHATSRELTLPWDTSNASPGEHTLKVEIPPVPGEQNTEDNVKTVTIEVKEPSSSN